MQSASYKDIFTETINLVEQELQSLLANNSRDYNTDLIKAMRYSCIKLKGKKLRPILFIETAKMLGVPAKKFLNIAAAIEMVHVYSLIHDDLPCMDDDDYRRGKPSCHKQFNESTALLSGNSLLTLAFKVISASENCDPIHRCNLIAELSDAIGHAGMMQGQQIDIESKTINNSLSENEILELHQLKTAELIIFSCKSAAIVSNCTQNAKNDIVEFARNLGLIFQITDDLLDAEVAAQHSDKVRECNIAIELGVEKTKARLRILKKQAICSLDRFGVKADNLKILLDFIVNRNT